jgi:predicted peroxiredoxin
MAVSKFVFTGTYASDDPTRAVLPFLNAKAAAEGGHEAEVFLVGEAVYLMKDAVADACSPVGWPKVSDVMRDVIGDQVPIYV